LLAATAGCAGQAARPQAPPASATAEAGKPPAASSSPAAKAAAQAAAGPGEVVIDNFAFKPARLTVTVGTKVTWVNHDDVPHTATSTAKPRAFDSGTLDTDQRFSYVFTTPGTYDYFCVVHPHMTGQIIVVK
jgi:plastocyanin